MLWFPELAAEIARQNQRHADVAEAVGCAPATISQIIRGRTSPSESLRHRIADYLDADEATLFAINPAVADLAESRLAQGLADRAAVLRRVATLATDRGIA